MGRRVSIAALDMTKVMRDAIRTHPDIRTTARVRAFRAFLETAFAEQRDRIAG